MAKEKIWPHPLAPVWPNLGDPQGHTMGKGNFFVSLFQGWQCTWIISKHPTLMLWDLGATRMAKEKIWPHPLAPVWLNLGDPQRHTIGISNFFVCLFHGWQCTWIISKHPTLML